MPDNGPPIRFDGVVYWYTDWFDPDDDRCSFCRNLIPQAEVPFILFRSEDKKCEQARFHWTPCGEHLISTGYVKIRDLKVTGGT